MAKQAKQMDTGLVRLSLAEPSGWTGEEFLANIGGTRSSPAPPDCADYERLLAFPKAVTMAQDSGGGESLIHSMLTDERWSRLHADERRRHCKDLKLSW